MMIRKVLLTGAAAAALGAFGAATAHADNIVLNQWYTGYFTVTGTPLVGPAIVTGVNGPVLPSGTADAIMAPAGSSWTITLAGPGYLTVTDVEISGDQFQLFDNGVAMTPTAGALGGQAGLAGGFTSVPVFEGTFGGEDISAALADPNFSSGTFALVAGVNTITGTFLGGIENGQFDFIAEAAPAPEPASIALFGAGLLGLGLLRRRQRQ